MRSFVYPANLSPEKGGGFTVQFPDLPEAITSGKDRADARLQAADCLEEAIAGRIADGLGVPVPNEWPAGNTSRCRCPRRWRLKRPCTLPSKRPV